MVHGSSETLLVDVVGPPPRGLKEPQLDLLLHPKLHRLEVLSCPLSNLTSYCGDRSSFKDCSAFQPTSNFWDFDDTRGALNFIEGYFFQVQFLWQFISPRD